MEQRGCVSLAVLDLCEGCASFSRLHGLCTISALWDCDDDLHRHREASSAACRLLHLSCIAWFSRSALRVFSRLSSVFNGNPPPSADQRSISCIVYCIGAAGVLGSSSAHTRFSAAPQE